MCAVSGHDGLAPEQTWDEGAQGDFPSGDLSPHRGAAPERRRKNLLLGTTRSDDQEHG